jgi:hypothetical protein
VPHQFVDLFRDASPTTNDGGTESKIFSYIVLYNSFVYEVISFSVIVPPECGRPIFLCFGAGVTENPQILPCIFADGIEFSYYIALSLRLHARTQTPYILVYFCFLYVLNLPSLKLNKYLVLEIIKIK